MRAAAVCVVGALLALVLKKGTPSLALLLSIGVAAVVMLSLGEALGELTVFFRELGEQSGLSRDMLAPLFKITGIALVVKAGSGLCRDAGESALAGAVETAGSVCGLLAALKALRFRLAQEAGVPAYIVFSNASLADMAALRPLDMEEFLQVSGVGKVKAERYGEAFLKAIRDWRTGVGD